MRPISNAVYGAIMRTARTISPLEGRDKERLVGYAPR
jgi:hypothetical protein